MASRDLTRTEAGRRSTTETKQAFKTTEFWIYLTAVIAVLIAADNLGGGIGHDVFRGDKAWLLVAILTVGYLISRGLAKAGSREPYTEVPSGDGSLGVTDRLTKAAAVLRDGEAPANGGQASAGPGQPVSAGERTVR